MRKEKNGPRTWFLILTYTTSTVKLVLTFANNLKCIKVALQIDLKKVIEDKNNGFIFCTFQNKKFVNTEGTFV